MNCTPPMKEGQVRKTERNEREKEERERDWRLEGN